MPWSPEGKAIKPESQIDTFFHKTDPLLQVVCLKDCEDKGAEEAGGPDRG